jgi:2-polyprenyl-3-methyl-5-hydroxy-6-metoxy-1,4-benzoquinol methylase
MLQADRRTHWDAVYETKHADDVSWFQERPELSLSLIRRTGVPHSAAIVDIGAGASTLADCLLADGYSDLTVLDIAAPALDHSKARLGEAAQRIEWIASDVTAWRPHRAYDLWHDRAVLHFLTDSEDQARYAETIRAAVKPDGWAIIGGFAPNGPTRCSGLDVVRHNAESLRAILGADFALRETHGEVHVTPQGREQAFRFHVFERRG